MLGHGAYKSQISSTSKWWDVRVLRGWKRKKKRGKKATERMSGAVSVLVAQGDRMMHGRPQIIDSICIAPAICCFVSLFSF